MKHFLNKKYRPSIVLVFFPVILSFLLESIVQEINFTSFPNFIENFLFAIVFFLIINLFITLKVYKKLIVFFLIIYYLVFFIESGLYLLFQTRMNAAYLYVVLNTNFHEVREFSDVYFENNLYWLLLFFIPLLNFFPKQIFRKPQFKLKQTVLNCFIILVVAVIFKIYNFGKWNLPYTSIKSYLQYKQQIDNINKYKEENKNITVNRIADNKTIVVVVGESTTRNHMEIYGYHRATTPRLKALSDSLIVYKDIISSHVYTTASMFDIFTLSNYETPKNSHSLLSYLKKSDYKVFWLSNQRPVGLNDNLVSRLASTADESVFLSYNDFRHITLHDEILLEKLKEKLKYQQRKVIFLHLIGTHYDYSKRYPDSYSIFYSEDNTKENKLIDTYDNAVLYNDYIVSQVIKLVSKASKKSAVIYFSDHGEEVYDTADYFGHFDDKPTPAMYEIPFCLYLSKDFEKPDDFIVDTSRKYMLDDFSHSLTHLIGIQSEFLETNRSVFSKKFRERQRIIKDSIDFDTFKKGN